MIKLRGGREGGVARQGRVEETEGQTRWRDEQRWCRQGSSPAGLFTGVGGGVGSGDESFFH